MRAPNWLSSFSTGEMKRKPFRIPTRPPWADLPSTLEPTWYAVIILMCFRALRSTRAKILCTALETSASAAIVLPKRHGHHDLPADLHLSQMTGVQDDNVTNIIPCSISSALWLQQLSAHSRRRRRENPNHGKNPGKKFLD